MVTWNQDAAEAAEYRRDEPAERRRANAAGHSLKRRTVAVVCRGGQHANPVRREVNTLFAKAMAEHVAGGRTLSKSQRKSVRAVIRRGVVRELRGRR